MNKVLLVGRLTRDPELRSLPSGKHVATFTIATNEYRSGKDERTEYHPCVAWDRLAEITGQFLSKGQLVDIEGRLQTRQWDDDAGKRHWKTEVVVASLEMLSGRSKKEYAKEAQAVAEAPTTTHRLRTARAPRATSRRSSRCDPSGGGAHPPAPSPDQPVRNRPESSQPLPTAPRARARRTPRSVQRSAGSTDQPRPTIPAMPGILRSRPAISLPAAFLRRR